MGAAAPTLCFSSLHSVEDFCASIPVVFSLIGQPQNPLALGNLMDFLQPGPLLGSAREFEAQYERRSVGEDEAKEAIVQLRKRLHIETHDKDFLPGTIGGSKAIFLRRTKEEHLPGLPQKREHLIECRLTAEQRKHHVAFIQQARATRGIGSAFSLLSSLNKLCQHPVLLNDGSLSDKPLALIATSEKLRAVIDL